MKRGTVIVAAVGLVLALAAAGCGGSGGSTGTGAASGGKPTIAGQSVNNHGTQSVSGATKMKLGDYYFKPTVLTGKPGASIKLELKNEGTVEHNLTVPSQGIDMNVEAGKDATVTVKIPTSGVVAFYCKFHRSMGMAGALAVKGANLNQGNTGTQPTTTTTKGYGY
jgi:plastocyanin